MLLVRQAGAEEKGLTRKPWFLDSFLYQQRTREPDFSGTLGEEDEMKMMLMGVLWGERDRDRKAEKTERGSMMPSEIFHPFES